MATVRAETIVQWRKEFRSLDQASDIITAIKTAYVPSTKHSRGGKRRNHLTFPLSIDENLGLKINDPESNGSEEILKPVLMALNRLSTENVDAIASELTTIKNMNEDCLKRVATMLLHKATAEKTFRQQYIQLVDNLDWVVDAEDGYRYTTKTSFLLELQKRFENIQKISKDEGCQLMGTLGCVYNAQWLDNEVFDAITSRLLNFDGGGNIGVEFLIAFLKACPRFEQKSDVVKAILAKPSPLPMRLRMMLEAL